MILPHLYKVGRRLILILFVCFTPILAHSVTVELIQEKHIEVAMRMIGHEVLMSLGDCDSRVLPIEKIEGHYKISFESEFGFDPDELATIIDGVLSEASISNHYFVEVEQCGSQKVVHSFEVGTPGLMPCQGRIMPEDCYSLLITFIEDATNVAYINSNGAENGSDPNQIISGNGLGFSSKAFYLLVPSLLLIGFIGFIGLIIRRKNESFTDPNLIRIGATQFNKKSMTLSYDNQDITLSHKEAALLTMLHSAQNTPIEREVLLQQVWGDEGDYVGRTLDVFISKLRKKFEFDSSVKIINIRGVGYKLVT